MFSGTLSTVEILKIAFNIDLAFGSVELEFHRLLAFIIIVLISPPPRALRLGLWFRKSPGVTYSTDMEKKEEEIEQLKMDCEHFRARLETAQADCMREKKEKLDLRQQLNEAKQQLLQQAEYCTEMGAAVCTLLWGVSSNEEAVKTLLGGVSMADVAALACGREFLVSSSRELLDTMMHLLGDMKPGLCTKFKVYDDFFFLLN
ncbi:hypothetical protein llap_17982 [Limosa lapponica baueri]|uniref:Heat shock factor 2-binding protein n=1 Tax=Limosa lapponica baueri TaxID=1758121 RepID=A0A2I0TD35_LIMLA|nr:hypothetical protein llap_17982 [Limosa lapponica baueri]